MDDCLKASTFKLTSCTRWQITHHRSRCTVQQIRIQLNLYVSRVLGMGIVKLLFYCAG